MIKYQRDYRGAPSDTSGNGTGMRDEGVPALGIIQAFPKAGIFLFIGASRSKIVPGEIVGGELLPA